MDVSALQSLGLGSASTGAVGNKKDIGQDQFLELMLAQMKNQDPLKPMENGDFLAQLAQFSTATGVSELKTGLDRLTESLSADKALTAASLIGRDVLVASDTLVHDGGGAAGALDLSAAGAVRIDIVDAAGQTMRTLDLGTRAAGLVSFQWDGLDNAGGALPAGSYSVRASVRDGESEQALPVLAVGRVDSVDLSGPDLNLHTLTLGNVALGDVRRIL
ncbi:flagellar hook assembly protein FlgD [Salinisphaera sp. P385]|uniref:Basal-body rod modification protein FlgD n=1 Tax=Spectribacter acetivorans TaxID=3075603 RepID=A0ABU3BB72_9GAMM|nr:flagellar hook assembly protein FlgD [Salinisphaera sp. P385]MDT0618226.1 flagellar hook assembly protein FlgD [Salinisphaera sp. P385]